MFLNPLGTKDEPPKAEHYVIARLTSRGGVIANRGRFASVTTLFSETNTPTSVNKGRRVLLISITRSEKEPRQSAGEVVPRALREVKKENRKGWPRCSLRPALCPYRSRAGPATQNLGPPSRARTHQLQRAEEDERAAPRAAAHGGGAPRLLLGFPPRCRAKRGLTASGRSGRVPLPSSSPFPRLCFSTSFVGGAAAPRSAAGGRDSARLWGRGRGRGWACAERGGPGGACCGDRERRRAGEGYEGSGL